MMARPENSDRLSNREITLLQDIVLRCGAGGRVTIARIQRAIAAALWRKEMIEIWYRQAIDANPSLQGPFYSPTVAGSRLAAALRAGLAQHRATKSPHTPAPGLASHTRRAL
jgi:hypothetical protein